MGSPCITYSTLITDTYTDICTKTNTELLVFAVAHILHGWDERGKGKFLCWEW